MPDIDTVVTAVNQYNEQIEELRSYVQAGKSNNEIAELMERSYSSIISIIHKCGCKRQ